MNLSINLSPIALNSLYAALFATALGLLLTAPARYLIATFIGGFAGRFVRDVFMGCGLSQEWSTVIAAIVIALLASIIVRTDRAPPVVLICAALPLGAAVAMLNAIYELMRLTYLKGDALNAASVALNMNAGKAFTGTLAIALGLVVGMAITRLFARETSHATA
jgi:uncharacterized membrane protein YjjB (DUF3815 family)